MSALASFIAGLPKAELHVHHVGSASPRIVADLAARHAGSTPVPADQERSREYFVFRDFAHFIEVYLSVVDLIRDPQDVWTLTYEVAQELAAQQVRYAELTVTPYSSIHRGIAAEAFCEAIEDARVRAEADYGVVLRWCFDIPGEAGLHVRRGHVGCRAATSTRRAGQLRAGRPGGRCRAGAVRPLFAQARAAGLHSVPHAGESTGPQSIWDALRHLGAERIGHGIAAARDPELLGYLAEAPHSARGLPDLERLHPPVPSLAQHLASGPGRSRPVRDDQLRRPANVRDHAEPGVRACGTAAPA